MTNELFSLLPVLLLLLQPNRGSDDGKFDLILSAETLYTEASCNKVTKHATDSPGV